MVVAPHGPLGGGSVCVKALRAGGAAGGARLLNAARAGALEECFAARKSRRGVTTNFFSGRGGDRFEAARKAGAVRGVAGDGFLSAPDLD
jgi:hypothetical protein